MFTIYGLCSITWTNYLLDIVVIAALVFSAVWCGKKGLIECFFGVVSTLVALVAATLLTKAIMELTGGLFGLQDVLSGSFENAFLKIKGFNTDISNEGLTAVLAEKNLPKFLIDLILDNFGNKEIEVGTTLALVVGATFSKLCITFLTWAILYGIAWLVMWFIKAILKAMAKKITLIGKIDTVLGCVSGLIVGMLVVYLVLAILALIPSEAITNYLDNSLFVGALYNNNLIHKIIGWMAA